MSCAVVRRFGFVLVLLCLAGAWPHTALADPYYQVQALDDEPGYRSLLVRETFEYDVEAEVICAAWQLGWILPASELDYYVLDREELGGGFNVGDGAHWRQILRTRPIDSVGIGSLECGPFDSHVVRNHRLIAPAAAGVYYLTACLPPFTQDGELVTSPFFRCSSPILLTVSARPAPDLIVVPIQVVPPSPAPGDHIRLVATVRNIGNGPAAPGRLRFFVDGHELVHDGQDVTAEVPALEVGAMIDQVARVTALRPGTYEYAACLEPVDGAGPVADHEVFVDNNCSRPFQVRVEAPNPSVAAVTKLQALPARPAPGAPVQLAVQVANLGSSPSAPAELVLREMTEETRPNGRDIGIIALPGLDPGQRITEQHTLTAPAASGTVSYDACIGERCFGWQRVVVE